MFLWWSLVGILLLHIQISHALGSVPQNGDEKPLDSRIFENVCENCTVSTGLGFASHPTECNCFYTCVLGASNKLASYANPWVSYLKCCPCSMTFSKKLLTCVDYTDKRSDCFEDGCNNPCYGVPAGKPIARVDPEGDDALCAGFIQCVQVGTTVVPMPKCCDVGCFNDAAESCEVNHCTAGLCADLRPDEKDDCECDHAPELTSECAFMEVSTDITRFMGVENMKIYQCSAGTCWDQTLCTCVSANNTGYDECLPFAEFDLTDGDVSTRDGRGNSIYTIVNDIYYVDPEAVFFNDIGNGNISVSGLANTWLSNRFSMHVFFTLRPDQDRLECVVGSCTDVNNDGNDTFAITVENEIGDDDNLFVYMTYKDKQFWIPDTETTERVTLELPGDYEYELQGEMFYDFWLFYGWDERVIAGVIREDGLLASIDSANVPGSVALVPPQSGFVFGQCGYGEGFVGGIDVEMWRDCKALENSEFAQAYDIIKTAVDI